MSTTEQQLSVPAQGGPGDAPEPSRASVLAALEALGQPMVLTDAHGRVSWWGSAAARLYGWSETEAVGRELLPMVVPGDVDRVGERVRADLAAAGQSLHHCAVRHRNGRGFSVALTVRRIEDGRGSLLFVSREETGEALITTDFDGTVRWATAEALRLYGYEGVGLTGRHVSTLVPPYLQDELAELIMAVRNGVPVELSETQRLRRDGSLVSLSMRVAPLVDAHGTAVGMSCTMREVGALQPQQAPQSAADRRYRARFEQAGMPQMILDLAGAVIDTNEAMCRLVGLDRSQLIGRTTMQLHHPSDRSAGSSLARDLFEGRVESAQWERLFARGDGSPVPLLISTALVRDEYGAPDSLHSFFQDLSLQRKAEEAVRASEARYRAIAETAQEGIWVGDFTGRTLFANQKVADILGRSVEYVYETNASDILAAHDPEPQRARLAGRAERGPETYEVDYYHPDGGTRRLRLSVSPMLEVDPPASLAMISDVTAMREAEEQLRSRALHDDLTGLPNRTLMADRIEHALARQARTPEAASVAVLLADLDDFKLVNDTWGHAAGDQLLREVAGRLSGAVRPGDTVARFGGDEFVILCENVTQDEAEAVAARIVEIMRDTFVVGGHPAYVAASIGIALSPPTDAATLLQYADTAMYEAKSRGRNQVQLFDVTLATNAAEHLLLGNDLREALTNGQLQLHYQPVVRLETGEMVKVEGLARWQHPTRGPVSPAVFVEVAERLGLGPLLDRWAISTGAVDGKLLRELVNPHLKVAVNISAANLADATLEHVQAVYGSVDVADRLLVLEITENALMQNPDKARETLERLRAGGVEAAIDDFGTGYSSLAYLSRLPVQLVKIDRSFIAKIVDDPDARAITAAIIDLAGTLGLRTVAEGVETREQLALLRELGCWGGQGWLWAPAMPLHALADKVAALPDGRFPVD